MPLNWLIPSETYVLIAFQLIKTELKGHARNSIGDEDFISNILFKLTKTVKGE